MERKMTGTQYLADEIERQNDMEVTGRLGVWLTPEQWCAVVARLRAQEQ